MKTKEPKLTTIKELKVLVIAEATKLKKKATKEEKDNLSFDKLRTNNASLCIYGQMVGNCFDDRAVELIEQSCTKVLKCVLTEDDRIAGTLNGSPKTEKRGNYWSPIEMFIDMERNKKNGNNKRLVEFLKGERTELKLR